MLLDLTGGSPFVVLAVFVAVVWALIRYGNAGSKGEKHDRENRD
ncbi:MAG: hypothetical protein AAFU41_05735 [Pseudomonadota bacterium]